MASGFPYLGKQKMRKLKQENNYFLNFNFVLTYLRQSTQPQCLRMGHHEDIFVLAGFESMWVFLRNPQCLKLSACGSFSIHTRNHPIRVCIQMGVLPVGLTCQVPSTKLGSPPLPAPRIKKDFSQVCQANSQEFILPPVISVCRPSPHVLCSQLFSLSHM